MEKKSAVEPEEKKAAVKKSAVKKGGRGKKAEPAQILMDELYDIAMGKKGFEECSEEGVSLNERLKAFELIAKYKKLPEQDNVHKAAVIIDDIGKMK